MFSLESIARGLSHSLILLPSLCVLPSAARAAPATLANMQAAYNGERNADTRYLAFAARADAEGYSEVANLFRAAARAEKIHARNHANVILEMGAIPQARIEVPEVKSTRENLMAAIQGESYERDTMYPEFLREASLANNGSAARSLDLARSAEVEHAKLCVSTLLELDRLQGTKHGVFYVCPVCGQIAREPAFAQCPTCFASKRSFEKVA